MVLNLHIPIKPFSDNRHKIPSRGRLIKNPEARKWQKDTEMYLLKYSREISIFKDFWSDTFAVKTKYLYGIPINEYFVKSGRISKTSGDCSNYNKITQDCIFDYIGINDAFVVYTETAKVPSIEYFINVKIEIITLQEINVYKNMI